VYHFLVLVLVFWIKVILGCISKAKMLVINTKNIRPKYRVTENYIRCNLEQIAFADETGSVCNILYLSTQTRAGKIFIGYSELSQIK